MLVHHHQSGYIQLLIMHIVSCILCLRRVKVIKAQQAIPPVEQQYSVTCLTIAWKAATRMVKIWKSNLSRKCKINIFTSTVESVLLYGAETWSLTVALNKRLDGCYTKLLRYALGYRWEDKVTNLVLYDTLPRVSEKVRFRRLQFAGHCFRSPQLVSDLLFWKPSGKFRSGQGSRRTYPQVLSLDSGRTSSELMADMANRQSWRKQISLS